MRIIGVVMSQQITTAMVDQFSANVFHLAQQEGSRLREFARNETQNAESAFWDRIGARKSRRKQGRHSDVIYDDTPHSRRMVTMEDFYSADLVDKEDKIRTIMDPENEYAKAIAMALGRDMDETIIEGALGNAYGGKKGTQVVALPDSQKVVAFVSGETTGSLLNIATLRKVRKKAKQSEAMKEGEKWVFVYAAQQADDLLGTTEVTSADFNTVRALVNGENDTFMGFKFVSTELLPFNEAAVVYDSATGTVDAGGDATLAIGEGRRCFAFKPNSGVLCALGANVNGRITEMPGKHYSNQVYGSLTIGATRMEEVQVIEVLCKEV